MAPRKPTTYHCQATRWSLDDLVSALFQRRTWTMSRSSVWRLLEEADLQPPRSVDWLHSHAPDVASTAHALCSLYLNALRFFAQGRVIMCSDEKPGRQILARTSPTPPLAPGPPEKREPEYIRHGTRGLIASFVGATGQVVWTLSQTRTRADFAAHLAHVIEQLPDRQRYDWGVDTLNTHWSLDVCRVLAQWGKGPFVTKDLRHGGQRRAFLSAPSHQPVFHCTPTQGSWLNQGEWWFSVFARRFLTRGDFCAAQDVATHLDDSLEVDNTHPAHPYRWT